MERTKNFPEGFDYQLQRRVVRLLDLLDDPKRLYEVGGASHSLTTLQDGIKEVTLERIVDRFERKLGLRKLPEAMKPGGGRTAARQAKRAREQKHNPSRALRRRPTHKWPERDVPLVYSDPPVSRSNREEVWPRRWTSW